MYLPGIHVQGPIFSPMNNNNSIKVTILISQILIGTEIAKEIAQPVKTAHCRLSIDPCLLGALFKSEQQGGC